MKRNKFEWFLKWTTLKNVFLIFIILALTSCNFLKFNKSSGPVDESTIQFHSKSSFADSKEVACFESEDFVATALNHYSIELFNKKFFSILNCSEESIVNRHDLTVIDTIYTFSNHKNKIQIYRAKHKDFIFLFDVTDKIFKLDGNIKPGMTKKDFFRKFLINEPKTDKVQITNSEGSIKFMFYFKNNKLKRIISQVFLD